MKRAKIIIPMGVVGAGKSVQGQLLAKDIGYQWVSTGEIFRSFVTGQQKADMLAGKLMSDEETIEIVEKFFASLDGDAACILDGFPRTLIQAQWLLEHHKRGDVDIEAIIHLDVSKEVVIERLLARGRPDDTPETITRRYELYVATTEPIIDWLKTHGVPVYEINGERDIEAIHADILASVRTNSAE